MSFFGMERDTFVAFISNPNLMALFSATLCALGIYLAWGLQTRTRKGPSVAHNLRTANNRIPDNRIPDNRIPDHRIPDHRIPSNHMFHTRYSKVLTLCAVIAATYLVVYALTKSSPISLSISILATSIPFIVNKNREIAKIRERDLAWPEAIDSLVSALQSGIPIPEAVISLSSRGPKALQSTFTRIEHRLLRGEDFSQVILHEKRHANSAISDQVFETLVLAKDFGGKDSNTALRLLAEFVREDLAVVEEIRTKFGWVKNSAVLATAAPWILLILLSTQSSTREAFASPSGLQILTLGILMTAGAFLWMEKVGALPVNPRALR
ncbi:MAG: type II secretion system F family protein [Candidatus Nanopelagicaceae bacterium]|jgi:tight adherence protein B|nr:type II secretion system F family protein [Candidatus Nanopelagicaceae bacterium]